MQACNIRRLLRKAIFNPILIKFKSLLSLQSKIGVSSKHLQNTTVILEFYLFIFCIWGFCVTQWRPNTYIFAFLPNTQCFFYTETV